MHFPCTEEKQRELAEKIAAVHAQTVIEMIKSMPCPMEQKVDLISRIKQKAAGE